MLKVEPGAATAPVAAQVMVMEPVAARAQVMVMEPGTATVAALATMGTAGMEKVVMGLGLTVTLTVMAVVAIMEDTAATVSPVITATPARVPTLAEDRVTVMGLGRAKALDQGTDRLLTVAAQLGAAVARDQRVEPGLLREMAVARRPQVPPAMAATAQHRLKAHTAFTSRNHRRCESIV